MERVRRIALGTAQFGLEYGIANRNGRPTIDEVRAIVRSAHSCGIDTCDTAIAYGDSEHRLGSCGLAQWKVVTKLPRLPEQIGDIDLWVRSEVEGSLRRLGVRSLWGLLLHNSADLTGIYAPRIQKALTTLKREGVVKKIGVSIYRPSELVELLKSSVIELVQGPLNIFDRRLVDTGCLSLLKERGIEFHARSVFLQGLLLLEQQSRPHYFERWRELFKEWDKWLAGSDMDRVSACLQFALSEPGVDRVVVGVDSQGQLNQIVAAARGQQGPPPPAALKSQDPQLVEPPLWTLKS